MSNNNIILENLMCASGITSKLRDFRDLGDWSIRNVVERRRGVDLEFSPSLPYFKY